MKKYLIGTGESRVLLSKNNLNIKGVFDILVLKDSNCCQISDIKANEIYLFNSNLNIVNGNICSKIIIDGGDNIVMGNILVGIKDGGHNSFIIIDDKHGN